MGKNIVILFDGTWNKRKASSDKNTNIAKLVDLINLPESQKFYDSGVGSKWYDKASGGLFGLGLDKNIRQGYSFLAKTYEPNDKVFIFGFSRGAYTARSLVGFIRKLGLLKKGLANDKSLIKKAYKIYRTRDSKADAPHATAFRSKNSRTAEIEFLGVFDTVGSLGIPRSVGSISRIFGLKKLKHFSEKNRKKYEFHDTELSSIVRHAYHAMAIDERRADFDITMWKPIAKPNQVLEQVWFAGVHSDVGGGYKEAALSDLALQWMARKAAQQGLPMSPVPTPDTPDKEYPHDSYKSFYKALGQKIREVGGPVHQSALAFKSDPNTAYNPSNVSSATWNDVVN